MKKYYEDKSYIEVKRVNDKIVVIIAAIDKNNSLKKIINAIELTDSEFKELILDI